MNARMKSALIARVALFAAAACSNEPKTGSDTAGAAAGTNPIEGGSRPIEPGTTAEGGLNDPGIASLVSILNASEIEGGKAAQSKARGAEVKAFAQQMVTDHQAMQAEMDHMTAAKGMTPQTIPLADSVQRSMAMAMDSVGRQSGTAFDVAYIQSQIAAHQQALDLMNRAAAATKDLDIKNALLQAMSKTQAHLDKARLLAGSVGRAGGSP